MWIQEVELGFEKANGSGRGFTAESRLRNNTKVAEYRVGLEVRVRSQL